MLFQCVFGGTDTTNTRSPSLRDLVSASGTPHGGFMHDGSLPTEAAAMTFSEQDGTQSLTFRASGVPNVGYLFQTSPDLDKWTSTPINASVTDVLEMTVPVMESEKKLFYRYVYGVNAD